MRTTGFDVNRYRIYIYKDRLRITEFVPDLHVDHIVFQARSGYMADTSVCISSHAYTSGIVYACTDIEDLLCDYSVKLLHHKIAKKMAML